MLEEKCEGQLQSLIGKLSNLAVGSKSAVEIDELSHQERAIMRAVIED
jgi:hypothetical protein